MLAIRSIAALLTVLPYIRVLIQTFGEKLVKQQQREYIMQFTRVI